MKQQPSYYAIITADVRYSKDISANAKLLFAEITALSQKEGFAWASNQYFADLYGVDKDTISRWVGELNKANFIKVYVDKNAGNLRKIYIGAIGKNAYPIPKNADSYPQKRRHPIPKNADIIIQENNTKNRVNKKGEENRGKYSPAKEKLRKQVKEIKMRKK